MEGTKLRFPRSLVLLVAVLATAGGLPLDEIWHVHAFLMSRDAL